MEEFSLYDKYFLDVAAPIILQIIKTIQYDNYSNYR